MCTLHQHALLALRPSISLHSKVLSIGCFAAEAFAKAGATVIVNGRKKEAVDKAVAELSKGEAKGRIHGVVADVADSKGLQLTLSGTHTTCLWLRRH
jgi:hypothetical protein